jgi:hypothetical protein
VVVSRFFSKSSTDTVLAFWEKALTEKKRKRITNPLIKSYLSPDKNT